MNIECVKTKKHTLSLALGIMHLCDPLYQISLDLTLYLTILTFNDPEEEDFQKHFRKWRKCW